MAEVCMTSAEGAGTAVTLSGHLGGYFRGRRSDRQRCHV
jgi:hypothetical protein